MKRPPDGKRLKRPDCSKCEDGWIIGTVNGKRVAVGRCSCVRWVEFRKSSRSGEAVKDGVIDRKSAACGDSE